MFRQCQFEDIDQSKITDTKFYEDALESGRCLFGLDGNIIYQDGSLGDKYKGFYISTDPDIHVWLAREYEEGQYTDSLSVGSFPPLTGFMEVIDECRRLVNYCPVCGKHVPLSEQEQYSFAGRCCAECLPEMQKQYEQPGWYN